MEILTGMKIRMLCVVLSALQLASTAWGQAAAPAVPGTAAPAAGSVYLKVKLNPGFKLSRLKVGDGIEGTLADDVYSGEQTLFAAGSRLEMTVSRVERRKKERNDRWPWAIRAFAPRKENYPVFESARITTPDGATTTLQASLASVGPRVEVRATPTNETAAGGAKEKGKRQEPLLMTVEAVRPASGMVETSTAAPAAITLDSGTQARIILLGGVSASESRAGDGFQARLIQPVRLNSKVVLPEGTLFQGNVVRSRRPRWLSRAGSLMLEFNRVTLPGGAGNTAAISVSGAELDPREATRMNAEGQMKGGGPGRARMLINSGVAFALGKVVDDGLQVAIEAAASAATDASTAGTARIAALCVSGVFMVTRHGRDVILPKFTELNVTFDRPFSLVTAPGQQ